MNAVIVMRGKCERVDCGDCRVFALIETSVHQHTRGSDSASSENLNPEEAMLDVCLLSTTNSIMQQCSLPIYTVSFSLSLLTSCSSSSSSSSSSGSGSTLRRRRQQQ